MCCGVEKGYDGTKLAGWVEGTCGKILLYFSLVWVHKDCIPAHTYSCEHEGSAIYSQRFDNRIYIISKCYGINIMINLSISIDQLQGWILKFSN